MDVLDYTPCRYINSYRMLSDDRVLIITFDGMITLQGAGKTVWMNADGKKTIREIIQILEQKNTSIGSEVCREGVLKLIRQLKSKGLIIANWDPLYKNELPQEI